MTQFDLRLDPSIQEMRQHYPQFSVSGLAIGTGSTAVWKGVIQPVQSQTDLAYLLDDLFHDREVEIFAGGRLEHLRGCRAQHCEHHWMEEITNPFVEFKVEVRYGGGREHPRAHVLEPDLPKSVWKHSFEDGTICPYAPWERVWSWTINTVADFMDHVVIWLVKSIVWLQAHIWIGDERQHGAKYLLTHIEADAPCWCSSGRRYRECHRPHDELKLLYSEIAILQAFERRNPFAVAPAAKAALRTVKGNNSKAALRAA